MYNIKYWQLHLNVQNWVFRSWKQSIWAIRWSLATMDSPDPKPTLSPVQQKTTKRELTGEERHTNCFEVVLCDATLGYWRQVFARHTNGRCGEFHVTRRTISRVWARALDIFHNPDIHQFALCQLPTSPRKKKMYGRLKKWSEPWWNSRSWYTSSPSLREGPSGSLLMLLECGNLFGIVCHDGRGMRTTMACEVDNDVNLPY